jgi:hypothetical protein
MEIFVIHSNLSAIELALNENWPLSGGATGQGNA